MVPLVQNKGSCLCIGLKTLHGSLHEASMATSLHLVLAAERCSTVYAKGKLQSCPTVGKGIY